MFDLHKKIVSFYGANVALPYQQRKDMKERRDVNRKRLNGGLVVDSEPAPFGCHTQGSYAMRTMVQDPDSDYDIDDGVYFNRDALLGPNGGERTPGAIKEMVRSALEDKRFKRPAEIHTNCVRVFYNEGYHVDVPAYRRSFDALGNATFELASTNWKPSDPLSVTMWFRKANKERSPDQINDGQMCRIIKYLKAFARSRNSWKGQVASGFMISVLVVETYIANADREDQCIRDTMQAIYNRLLGNMIIDHPVLNEHLTKSADDPRVRFLRDKLAWALQQLQVLDDWDCTREEANAAWNAVFQTEYFTDDPTDIKSPPILKSSSDTAGLSPVDRRGGGRFG